VPPEHVEKTNILSILENIEKLYDPEDEYANHIILANIIHYIVEVAKMVDEEQKIAYNFVGSVEKNSEIINRIIQFINDNIDQKISVDTISKEMNFCKSYVQHLFKDGMGVPISKYILIQKMQTANFLLEEGKTLKEVAKELGYKYYPTFFSAYKKFFGYSPKERKKLI
jgi:AraC-like DNA-binding protein